MFEQDYYKRIIDKQQTPKKLAINTTKPWFPHLKHRVAVKDYEYKFFVLPPNKMVSLLKKQKINIPSDEQIREFLKNHSLKHIVKYSDDFKNLQQLNQIQSPRKPLNDIQILLPPSTTKSQTSLNRHYSVQHTRIRELKSQQIHRVSYTPQLDLQQSPIEIDKQKQKLRLAQPSSKSTTVLSEKQSNKIKIKNRNKYILVEQLQRSLKKLKLIGICTKDIIKIFPKKSFEQQFSKEFIFAAKQGKIEQIQSFLLTQPYLVFAFDYYNMTALHWACKQGHLEIIKLLLDNYADFDAIDLMNRTPLSISIAEGYTEIVRLLLKKGAYPWSTQLVDLSIGIKKYPQIKELISISRKQQLFVKWNKLEQLNI